MDGPSPIFHTILLEATIVTSHLVPPTMLIMIVMSALITILHNLSTTAERIKVWQVGTYPCFCLVLTSAKSQKFQGCVVRHYSPVNKEYGIYQWKRQLMICVNTLPPFIMFILSRWARIGVHVYCRTNRCVPSEWLLSLAGRLLHHLLMDLNDGKILGTLECSLVLERHLLEIVFNASQSFVKRSIALATKYHSC